MKIQARTHPLRKGIQLTREQTAKLCRCLDQQMSLHADFLPQADTFGQATVEPPVRQCCHGPGRM